MIYYSTVELDVGGKIFKTTIYTLRESGFLYRLLSKNEPEGVPLERKRIFIDRDGISIQLLLYLYTIVKSFDVCRYNYQIGQQDSIT
ncbi:hypothetical protein BD770DRAFT_378308 [Pilaira anomala]|nr:hypothetical protein BD770DRAFT_378308 [Pilaira anomala]